MKASEAKKLSDDANTGNLDEVYAAIQAAAKKGDYAIHIYVLLTNQQKAELLENGYKVIDVSGPNETCIGITWKEEA